MKLIFFISIALIATAYAFFIATQPDDEQYTYLTSANELISKYQTYSEKVGEALKIKSSQELSLQKKELAAIVNSWGALKPTSDLRGTHELMTEALNDDLKSLELMIEGIKNRDNAKLKKAIEISDLVAEKVEKVKEELKRLLK